MRDHNLRDALRRLSGMALAALLVFVLAASAFAADGYYLTWDEYKSAHGIENWNYHDQAAAIAEVSNHAVELYEAGEADEA